MRDRAQRALPRGKQGVCKVFFVFCVGVFPDAGLSGVAPRDGIFLGLISRDERRRELPKAPERHESARRGDGRKRRSGRASREWAARGENPLGRKTAQRAALPATEGVRL